ncbi:MAG: DsbA family protein [bacterium]
MKKLILFLIIIGGLLLTLGIYRITSIAKLYKEAPIVKTIAPRAYPNDPIRGNSQAPVTIIVFSDYQCPSCKAFDQTVRKLLDVYPDKLRLVWKDFPLSYHTESPRAALAARCAGQQGKYWQYHDSLYDQQDNLAVELYGKIAVEIGLDAKRWQQCYDSGSGYEAVQAGQAQGTAAGIDGVPAVFINGKLTDDVSYSSLEKIITAGQ